jgi:hypothetical protein
VTDRRASLLMWFGVWAAPVAWALQHAAGVMFGLAQCNPNGTRWQVPLKTWDVLIAGGCAVVAVAGIVAAIMAFRGTSDRSEAPPPGSRIHFMATMALTIGPLFLAIIVLNGLGTGLNDLCRQS